MKLMSHTGFSFICLWSEDVLHAKLCVLLPLLNLALLVHCVYMAAQLKITLCHAQSINSPIAPCVNFGLRIPLKYHNTLGRQKNANLLLILYRLWRKQWCKLRISYPVRWYITLLYLATDIEEILWYTVLWHSVHTKDICTRGNGCRILKLR